MNQRRFATMAAAVGAAIPLLWLLVYWVVARGSPVFVGWAISERHLQFLSILWPSWPLLMADPEGRSIAIPAVSVAINGMLYGVAGWLIWFGLYRNRAVLALVVGLLIALWYILLRWLYTGA